MNDGNFYLCTARQKTVILHFFCYPSIFVFQFDVRFASFSFSSLTYQRWVVHISDPLCLQFAAGKLDLLCYQRLDQLVPSQSFIIHGWRIEFFERNKNFGLVFIDVNVEKGTWKIFIPPKPKYWLNSSCNNFDKSNNDIFSTFLDGIKKISTPMLQFFEPVFGSRILGIYFAFHIISRKVVTRYQIWRFSHHF